MPGTHSLPSLGGSVKARNAGLTAHRRRLTLGKHSSTALTQGQLASYAGLLTIMQTHKNISDSLTF